MWVKNSDVPGHYLIKAQVSSGTLLVICDYGRRVRNVKDNNSHSSAMITNQHTHAEDT